jgi:hypothetical protein
MPGRVRRNRVAAIGRAASTKGEVKWYAFVTGDGCY